jgi:hypothetical protein
MANLDNIVPALRAAGLVVHELPGWITTGYAGQDLQAIRGVLWHHTATNRLQFNSSAYPTLNLVSRGRGTPGSPSFLPPPLCNILFDRKGEVWMVATGVANHAGRGIAPGIPRDMGNHYLIGIEMESSGIAPWDWTPAQLRNAPILGAALEKLYLQKLPPEQRLQLGHLEYSSEGKIDPAGWPGGMDGLRASINKILAGPAPKPPAPTTPKDDLNMATVDDFYNKPYARQGPGVSGTTNLGATIAWLDSNLWGLRNQLAAQDAVIKSLVGAVAALSKGQTFDEAKLLESIQARVVAGLGEVDDLVAQGVQAALDSIDANLTVNLKKGE